MMYRNMTTVELRVRLFEIYNPLDIDPGSRTVSEEEVEDEGEETEGNSYTYS